MVRTLKRNPYAARSRDQKADLKDFKRAKKPRTVSKTATLNMIEALIGNARVCNGICRHNHSINILNSGRIMIDDEPHGYIDKEDTVAAKYLIDHGYHILYVRNSPVIHTPEGDAVNITVSDVTRYIKRRR
jgi:hypothetical protein